MEAFHFSTLVALQAILIGCFIRGVGFMIDALFWYTGLIVWVLIVFTCVSMLAVEAHDRSVMTKRGPDIV
jgi:hypothetical protein